MTVEIDGANNIVKTNTISEVTSANGVTVDGLNIKDSKLVTADSVIQTNITDQAINEAKMQISNAPTNGYALTAQSGNTGGLTWASVGGITMCDTWHLTSSFAGNKEPINSNLSRLTSHPPFGVIGSAMTESSGIFTFPSTGIYLVEAQWSWYLNGSTKWIEGSIQVTLNNSSYASESTAYASISRAETDTTYSNASTSCVLDVTDTTNIKVRMISTANNTSTNTTGESNRMITGIRFTKLGDT